MQSSQLHLTVGLAAFSALCAHGCETPRLPGECPEGECCPTSSPAACNADGDCETGRYCSDGFCECESCGDGLRTRSEQCDSGEGNMGDNARCLLSCELNVCGDGLIDLEEEICDEGDRNGSGVGACKRDCSGVCEQAPCSDEGERLRGSIVPSAGVVSNGTDVLRGRLGSPATGQVVSNQRDQLTLKPVRVGR